MAASPSSHYAFADLADDHRWVAAYWELGYLVVTGVFAGDEMARLQRRFDRWYAEGMRHPATFRHGNKVIWIDHDDKHGKYVRGMQWPSYEDDVLDAVRTDARLLAILEPLIGHDLKQIINQLHWKQPGAFVTWGMHRDVRSRNPREAFRNLATSYVQTGLAVDRHWAGNGAMKILPRSHKMGRHDLDDGSGTHEDTGEQVWAKAGFDIDACVDVEMDPGDVALWGPFTVHGGGVNRTTDNQRRLYINGYVIADNCDRGEPVFRGGRPVALNLTRPATVQYDFATGRSDAHYPGRDDLNSRPSD